MVIEAWKNKGLVEVLRDELGRFISWRKYTSRKRAAIYGTCVIKGQRYNRRYEFEGRGRYLQRAIIQALRLPPKQRVVNVNAREFLMHPYEYGERGYWIDQAVES